MCRSEYRCTYREAFHDQDAGVRGGATAGGAAGQNIIDAQPQHADAGSRNRIEELVHDLAWKRCQSPTG